ncbi:MAG TPA: UDP-N-acetylglucosamine 1-carboxyvinyltransferase [Acidobacteriota bacterium]
MAGILDTKTSVTARTARTLLIEGRTRLEGSYRVQGNKNAALPLIAAALLARSGVRFRNVPRIWDVENMLALLRTQGAVAEWQGEDLWIDPRSVHYSALPEDLVHKLRGAILLVGPMAARLDAMESAFPGGCPIGARTFQAHWDVLEAYGYGVTEDATSFHVRRLRISEPPDVYMSESSVTATENALILFSALRGGTLHNAATEPHVLQLADFLRALGAGIETGANTFRVLRPVNPSEHDITFAVQPDFVDAGTMAVAAGVTGGRILLENVCREDLLGIEHVLKQYGVAWDWKQEDLVEVHATHLRNPARVVVGLWPGFPTDLASLVIVLSTQGFGNTLVHDWMYEARMFFVDKLTRMGARITLCDPHRVLVQGPTLLRGTALESPDIRAGMALIVAGLVAKGQTRVEHAEVVFRGYERIVERLSALGASIRED